MNVARRMKKLKALLDIRIGPGAAILSSDVKKIHLDFARKINDGHFGARKVWRNYLPRLKYHNPAVSMTVNRTDDQEGPATLTIHFAPPSKSTSPTASPAPASSTDPSTPPSDHNPSRRVETIDMKHKQDSEILSRLLELTKATPYEASPDELVELREVDDNKMRSDRDKKAQMRLNQIRKQEEVLLAQARGAGKLEGASL
ncbi:hypothetical protein OEA41_006258 [Lepraria neglecta]|uniref:Ribosomal protein/NADH dehydrogenase domain-containing protein n=1 Tax=Lepraria neglecta TaxID=209136 RepID=A0AAE0DK26_9LECA|nr:hypothetical protein OEA41_006258 [Lepraria neglecta]